MSFGQKGEPKMGQKDPFLYLKAFSFIIFCFLLFFSAFSEKNFQEPSLISPILSPVLSVERNPFWGIEKNLSFESPDFILVQNLSVRAVSSPVLVNPQILGSLTGDFEIQDVRQTIIEYVVEPNDTFSEITEKFNLSLDTILWANNLNKSSVLKPEQKLVIPPVNGVIHHVVSGDTVSKISQKYQAKSEDITSFNNLSDNEEIFIGDILIVPGGKMPAPKIAAPTPLTPLASSYFICPIPNPCNITQGLHWYNAVDFSNGKCGDPVYAAAGGKVLRVKLTESSSISALGGLGNHLTILHPNGVVTTYAHILTAFVRSGEQVSQGQIIGLVGGRPGTPGAGRSTGCHLHFGVTGAKNPFVR